MNERFERIEKGIELLGGKSFKPASSLDMDIDDSDSLKEVDEIDDIEYIGSSPDSASSDHNVTATGPSPQKKQKGDQGSDSK